jgi:PKD repeat protein
MSKTLTPFENHLKDVMSGYEANYDASSWQSLQKSLSKGTYNSRSWIVALVATLLVTTAGTVVIYKNRNTPATAKVSQSVPRFDKLYSGLATISANNEAETENQTEEQLQLQPPQDGAVISSNTAKAGTNNSNRTGNASNSGTSANNSSVDSNDNNLNNNSSNQANTVTAAENTDIAGNKASNVSFKTNINEACAGIEVDFQVTGPNKGSYLWNFGDGHYSNEVNPKHKFTKAGSYDVSLSITDDQGHITVRTMPDMVTIHPSPDASFEWDFVNETPGTPAVKIINTSEHAVTYEWKFGDGTSSNQVSPVKAFDEKGKHTVALEVTNEYGCSDGTVKQISVNADNGLGAQNGIVPVKEVFMPTYLKQNKTAFKMEIYNAEGKKVYETNNRNKGWDGTLADGSKAKEGESYQWKVVVFSDITKDEKYYNGTLMINP